VFRWGFIACALAGCAQLAGIDSTSKAPDGGDNIASLTLEHASIGRIIVRAPQDVTNLNASFLVADAAEPGGLRKIPATTIVDTFQGDVGGMPAMVQYESPELPMMTTRILDLPSRTLRALVPVLEHPNPTAPTPGATIDINAGLNPAQAAESYQLFTVGAWTNVSIAAPAAGAVALTANLTLMATNAPQRRLDKITTDDLVMLLRFNGNQLVGHLDAPPFDQMTADAIGGTIGPTPLDQVLDIRVNQNAATTRLASVRPAVGAPSFVWRINAAPGADLNFQNGPQLHAAGVAAPTGADPQTITAMYGNPFSANLKSLITWDVRGSRTFTGGAAMNTATLLSGLFERVEPSAGQMFMLPAGLPNQITANGTVLNDAAMTTTLNAAMDAPVSVTFSTDATTNTLYNLELFELAPAAMGMPFTVTKVVTVTAAVPAMKIPRDIFKPDTLYFLRAVTFQGCYTAVAEGDLTRMSLPCAQGFTDSGVFQVTP
jgi:hypothetical protein